MEKVRGGPSEKVTPKWTAKGTTGMCRRKSRGENEDKSLQIAWEEDEGRQGRRGWERTQDRGCRLLSSEGLLPSGPPAELVKRE